MRALTLAGGVVIAACVAVGCSDKTKQQAREAGQQANEAAHAAGEAVESAAQDAVNNAERASDSVQNASQRTEEAEAKVKEVGRSAREAVNEAADAAGAAAQTAKVKAALVADSKVEAAGINVDTDASTKTITLKGHVPSAAQKAAASRIAAEKASPGYAVRNDLVVK